MATKNDSSTLSGATRELADLKNKQKKEQKIVTSLEKKLSNAKTPEEQVKYATGLASARKNVSNTQGKIDEQQQKVTDLSNKNLTEEQQKALAAKQQRTAEQSKAEQEAAQANDKSKDTARKEEKTDSKGYAVIKPGIVDPQGIETTYNPNNDPQIATSVEAKKELAKYTDTATDVFYLDVKVFLEGVQVPHAQIGVSYGITNPASCTITLPANAFLRMLPGTTKILIIFRDLMPDIDGKVKYRVLFDGELSSISYSIDPTGAYVTLSGIHSTAYLTSMQLLFQDVKNYLMCTDYAMLGNSVTFQTAAGFNKAQIKILGEIFKEKASSLHSMADVAYLLVRFFLEHNKGSANESSASKWYYSKLGNTPGGHKILKRIFGVADGAKTVALNDFDNSYEGDGGNGQGNTNGTNNYGTGGSSYGSTGSVTKVGTNGSLAVQAAGAAKYVEGRTGVDANIIYTQWIFESGWFKSAVAVGNLNFAGLKCGSSKEKGTIAKSGKPNDRHRIYDSVQQFADAYCDDFIIWRANNGSSKTDLTKIKNVTQWATWLKSWGYYKSSLEHYINGLNSIKSDFYEKYQEYVRLNKPTVESASNMVKSSSAYDAALDKIFSMYKGTPYDGKTPNPPSTFDCQSWCHWMMECCGYTEFKGCGNNDEIFRVACEKGLIECSYYGLDYMVKKTSDDKYAGYLEKYNLVDTIPEEIKSKIGRVDAENRKPRSDWAHLNDGVGGVTDDIKYLLDRADVGDIILVHNGEEVRGHSGVYRGYYAGDSSGKEKHWWYVSSSKKGITEQSLEDADYYNKVESVIKVGRKMQQAWSASKKD